MASTIRIPTLFALTGEPRGVTEASRENGAGPASPPRRGRRRVGPVVTLTLLAVNVGVWLVTAWLAGPGTLANWLEGGPATHAILSVFGAKENALIHRGEYWRLITPLFLHAGIVHLGFNSLGLLMLGSAVERLYGRARFLVLYLFSGICGSIASYEFSPQPSVGASGAILGLAGVLIVFALRYRDRIAPAFRDEVRTVLAPQVFLILFIGFVFPAMDAMGHLGGFLGGCLLAFLIESPFAGPVALAREKLPVGTALLTGVALVFYGLSSAAANIHRQVPVVQAVLLQQSGRLDQAAEQYRQLLQRQSDNQWLRLLLIDTLQASRRWEEAAAVLADAVACDPANLNLRYALAATLLQAHRIDAAVPAYREVLQRDPNHAPALNDLAYTYVDTLDSHHEEALRMAKRAVELQPQAGAYWDTLGWAYYKNGSLGEAAAAQQRAVRLSGKDATVRYHMGAIFEAQGNPPAAAQEYRAALALDPGMREARTALERLSTPPERRRAPVDLSHAD